MRHPAESVGTSAPNYNYGGYTLTIRIPTLVLYVAREDSVAVPGGPSREADSHNRASTKFLIAEIEVDRTIVRIVHRTNRYRTSTALRRMSYPYRCQPVVINGAVVGEGKRGHRCKQETKDPSAYPTKGPATNAVHP